MSSFLVTALTCSADDFFQRVGAEEAPPAPLLPPSAASAAAPAPLLAADGSEDDAPAAPVAKKAKGECSGTHCKGKGVANRECDLTLCALCCSHDARDCNRADHVQSRLRTYALSLLLSYR
jgi:hypothetical protein